MTVEMLKGKIHRATVTQAELDYVGSITVDEELLDAAGILEYEKVQIVDVNNGNRFETYTICGEKGSGMICLNGAAARCVSVGDKIIIMAYAGYEPEEAKTQKPAVVFVDDRNKISRVTNYEKHGSLKNMERDRMQVTKTVEETRKLVKQWKREGKTIGLVPTMGFLHEGHASLIKRCREENDIVVVSDFVNPTQFGPNEDLEAYPRDFERDSRLCESLGCDLIFNPEPEEMYHDPCAYVSIDTLSETLCGKTRPIHFKGVCTVVSKLFHIVAPDRAYFGQKDAQQLAIIRKMVQDLNFDIEIVGCPIVREEDGLAKSSRNTYLSPEERKAALCLSRAIKCGSERIRTGMQARDVLNEMRAVIEAEPLAKIDYVSMVDALTMQPVEKVEKDVLVAMAVYIGKTRLIDNFSYEV